MLGWNEATGQSARQTAFAVKMLVRMVMCESDWIVIS